MEQVKGSMRDLHFKDAVSMATFVEVIDPSNTKSENMNMKDNPSLIKKIIVAQSDSTFTITNDGFVKLNLKDEMNTNSDASNTVVVGSRIKVKFDDNLFYYGYVTEKQYQEDNKLYVHITYDDGDDEILVWPNLEKEIIIVRKERIIPLVTFRPSNRILQL